MVSDLGQRVRRARDMARVSSRELSMLARLSPSALGHLDRGVASELRSSTVSALARVLGVSLDWLINGEGEEPTADQVRAAVDAARASESKGAA